MTNDLFFYVFGELTLYCYFQIFSKRNFAKRSACGGGGHKVQHSNPAGAQVFLPVTDWNHHQHLNTVICSCKLFFGNKGCNSEGH